MKFQIHSRFGTEVKYECELDASFESQSYGKQLGAAIKKALAEGSNLRYSNLSYIKADFFDVLLRASHEVSALESALRSGKVDGSQYEGECACLVGTIAKSRHCGYQQVPNLKPDFNRPSEKWFLAIRPGDTPESNPVVSITLDWIKEFNELLEAAKK